MSATISALVVTHLIQVFQLSFCLSVSHVWRLPAVTVRKLLALTVSRVLALGLEPWQSVFYSFYFWFRANLYWKGEATTGSTTLSKTFHHCAQCTWGGLELRIESKARNREVQETWPLPTRWGRLQRLGYGSLSTAAQRKMPLPVKLHWLSSVCILLVTRSNII